MVGRLRARREPDRRARRAPRPCRPAAPPAGRRPRSRPSRRGAPRPPARCRRRRPADGTRRSACRPPSPARAPRHRAAPLVWIIAWPLYIRSAPASGAITSSGTARMISSTSSTSGSGSTNARVDLDQRAEALAPGRVAAGDRVDRPAGTRQGHAEGRPDRAGADDPDDRRLAGLGLLRAGARARPARPGGDRSPPPRWRPRVSARSRSGSSPGRRPQAFIGPGTSGRRAANRGRAR